MEDATLLVRALRQKKAQLLKWRDHLKLVQAPCNQHLNRITKKRRTLGCMRQQQTSAVLTAVEINSSKSESPSSASEGQEVLLSTESATISAIIVHTGNDDIVVEMVWNQPSPNYQSSLIRAVEVSGLEVTRCSIVRVATWLVQCVLTCSKVRTQ